jgi:hypothetical protein
MVDQQTVEVVGEFDEITAARLPLTVTGDPPVFLAIFWEGQTLETKPRLAVRTPDGEVLRVRLPSPKPFYWNQVQMMSLAGFTFPAYGEFEFEVSADSDTCAHTLRVLSAPAVELISTDEAESEFEDEAPND